MKLSPKKSMLILLGFLLLALVAGIIGYNSNDGSNIAFVIGSVLAVIGVIFHIATNRCSHCHRYLGRSGFMHYCPHCGEKID